MASNNMLDFNEAARLRFIATEPEMRENLVTGLTKLFQDYTELEFANAVTDLAEKHSSTVVASYTAGIFRPIDAAVEDVAGRVFPESEVVQASMEHLHNMQGFAQSFADWRTAMEGRPTQLETPVDVEAEI